MPPIPQVNGHDRPMLWYAERARFPEAIRGTATQPLLQAACLYGAERDGAMLSPACRYYWRPVSEVLGLTLHSAFSRSRASITFSVMTSDPRISMATLLIAIVSTAPSTKSASQEKIQLATADAPRRAMP